MRKHKGLMVISILVFAFLFIPLIIIAVTAFGSESTITFPIHGFSLQWFVNVFESESFMSSLALSGEIALLATLLALLVGVPAAYALARYSVIGKKFLKSFFLSPTIIPGIVVGYALYQYVVLTLNFPVFESLLLGHFLVVLLSIFLRQIQSSHPLPILCVLPNLLLIFLKIPPIHHLQKDDNNSLLLSKCRTFHNVSLA